MTCFSTRHYIANARRVGATSSCEAGRVIRYVSIGHRISPAMIAHHTLRQDGALHITSGGSVPITSGGIAYHKQGHSGALHSTRGGRWLTCQRKHAHDELFWITSVKEKEREEESDHNVEERSREERRKIDARACPDV
eukprot:3538037-Rhodomonas_salina.2